MKRQVMALGVLALLGACRETVPASKSGAPDVGVISSPTAPMPSASAPIAAIPDPPASAMASASATTAAITPRKPKVHRAAAATCTTPRPPISSGSARSPYADRHVGNGPCAKDADCKDGKNGRCGPLGRRWGCSYDECNSDKDCTSGDEKGVCVCRTADSDVANTCKKGNCRVDADCSGSYCSPSLGSCGHMFGTVGYFCHTPKDECSDDDDCPGKADGACRYIPEAGHYKCATGECKG